MDPEDNGYSSRKFIFCIAVAGIIVGVGLLAGTIMPGVAAIYVELIGGVLGAAGLFVTGNIANKFVIAKTNPGVSFQGEMPAPVPAKPPTDAPDKPNPNYDPNAPEDDK